ncbi:MAG: DUF6291 domain-containing protein [Paludibacteraceae bacterium]|nr:DUF6291 domain-containing protein [Paludibacteraceae bacterium]
MKDSFILYTQFAEIIGELTDEQAGKMFKALFDYTKTGNEPEFSGILKMAWIPIRQQVDRANEKYQEKAGKNKVNGALGGRPPKKQEEPKNQTVISDEQEETEKPNGLEKNHMVISETETETEKPNGYFDNPNVLVNVPVLVPDNDHVLATTANADSSAPEAAAANFEIQKQKILEFWNCNCKNLPSVEKLTAKRGAALKTLFLAGYTPDEITDCMALANITPTLNGTKPVSPGKYFRALFDWVIDESNFVTLYEQRSAAPQQTDVQRREAAEKKRREMELQKKAIEDAINNMKARVYAEMKAEKGDKFDFAEYENRVKIETDKIIANGGEL